MPDQCTAMYEGQWRCNLTAGHDEAHETIVQPGTTMVWTD